MFDWLFELVDTKGALAPFSFEQTRKIVWCTRHKIAAHSFQKDEKEDMTRGQNRCRVYGAAALLVALLAIGLRAFANDTVARVGAGGIEIQKTDQISMIEEILEISVEQVRVRYRFRNESPTDIRTTVAFPMPAYRFDHGVASADANNRPLQTFRLWINGKEHQTKSHREAQIGGKDVTQKLRGLGLSDAQIFDTFGGCKPSGSRAELQCEIGDAKLKEIEKLAPNHEWGPAWKVAETAYWDQVFPAGKIVEVEHRYVPFAGLYYTAPFQGVDISIGDRLKPATANDNEACLDEMIDSGIRQRVKEQVERGEKWVDLTLTDVEYVLGTARNWKGPIRSFVLRVRKEKPAQLVSLCFPGKPKKLDPLTFEFALKDFVPPDKIVVYFYTIGKEVKIPPLLQ